MHTVVRVLLLVSLPPIVAIGCQSVPVATRNPDPVIAHQPVVHRSHRHGDYPPKAWTLAVSRRCAIRMLAHGRVNPSAAVQACTCLTKRIARTSGEWRSLVDLYSRTGQVSGAVRAQAERQIRACRAAMMRHYGDGYADHRSRAERIYDRRASHMVAYRIRQIRVREERALIHKDGHAVPLPTGVCVSTVHLNRRGRPVGRFVIHCTDGRMGHVMAHAIMAAAPFSTAVGHSMITVEATAPVAEPGANGD